MADGAFEMVELELRVLDSRQRDVARGIARIDQKTMEKLGVTTGDVVEIHGKKKTSAIVWPAYAADQDLGVMRIDGFTRKSASASINEYVTVRKAGVKNATSMVLTPVRMRLNVKLAS